METKEKLLKTIKENLSDMFVSDYQKVNDAMVSVNKYLKDIEINHEYKYNDFCKDFMNKSILMITDLNEVEMMNLNSITFVSETISYMIRQKIIDNVQDQSKKNNLLIQHELKKYLINY